MRSGVLVACVLLAGCKGKEAEKKEAPKATPDAAPTPPPSPIAKALAARTDPVYVPAPHAITSVGRCAVNIAARPPEEGAKVLAELERREPGPWVHTIEVGGGVEEMGVDEFSQLLEGPFREGAESTVEPPTEEKAVELAIAFLIRMYDLIGLEKDDLAVTAVRADKLDDRGRRDVHFDGERPLPGYEDFDNLLRAWDVTLQVERDGTIRFIQAVNHRLLPPFTICKDPKLSSDDAAKKSPQGADRITLDAWVQWTVEKGRTVTLAWEVLEKGGAVTHWVDADTGEIIRSIDNFVN